MRAMPLQLLTWGTITAAVSSAAWLTSTNQGNVFCSVGYRATSHALGMELPMTAEPTRAGSAAASHSSSVKQLQLQASAS